MYVVLATTFHKVYDKLAHLVDYQTDFYLSTSQFLIIASFTQVHLDYVLHFYNFMSGSNPGLIFVAYVFLQIAVTIPYNTFLLFLSSYSKSQYIKIWNCIPLFKGVGYTMLVARNVLILLNQIYVTNLLFLLVHTIWEHEAFSNPRGDLRLCRFPTATSSCLPINATYCDPNTLYEMSAIQYFRLSLIQGYGENQVYLSTINIALWLLSVPLVFVGVKRFVRVYVFVMSLCFGFFLMVLVVFSVATPIIGNELKRVLARITKTPGMELTEISFWSKLLIFVTSSLETGDVIWLGAQMPSSLKPPVAAAAISIFKIFGLALFEILMKNVLDVYIFTYPIVARCNVAFTSFNVVFEMVFDVLYTFDQAHIWIALYTISLAVYTFMNNCIAYMAAVDSIVNEYPTVAKHRMFICFLFAFTNCLLSTVVISPIGETILLIWNNYQGIMLGLIFFSLWSILLNYVYSRDMMITDYVFTYGEVPPSTLLYSWSACPVCALILMSITSLRMVFEPELIPMGKIVTITTTLIVFIPALASAVWTFVRALYHVHMRPDYPNGVWGPSEASMKLARERLVPRRDICYRHESVTCKHLCLLKVPEFEEERARQRRRFHQAARKILEEDGFPRELDWKLSESVTEATSCEGN